ncbi:MAG: glutamate mutase L [Anaerolineales bacterium]
MENTFEADTLLAIDVGSVHTRASLFDVVEGRYRLVASGRSLSTAGPPLFDVREGVRIALDQIQSVTGRQLVDEAEMLIVPVGPDGSGVDSFVATTSAGPRVKTVLVGLMPNVSMESGKRLAASTYLDVVGEIGLMDRQAEEEKIDLILRARPELMIVVGGTDGGATSSVLEMVDLVGLTADLFPEGEKPQVVFAGNRTLAAPVAERFDDSVQVTLTPNVRPRLSIEELAPARKRLAEVIADARSERVVGYDELMHWSGGDMVPTADAFGRVIRYLSQVYDPEKGVLGVDVGGTHTTVAASFAGELNLTVHSDIGLGTSAPGLLQYRELEDILRWMPEEVSKGFVHDYLMNKSLHPGTIPTERPELLLEFAITREIIRAALEHSRKSWTKAQRRDSVLLPPMEPILASGGILSRSPHPGYAALTLLDALEPVGISTLVLDPHSLSPALGAAAGSLPMAAVQVLSSGNYASLATVVAPVGKTRPGRPVLHIRMDPEDDGEAMEGQARYGQLIVLPLRQGREARLTLRPERGFDVGFGGPGKAGTIKVAGGAVGLIIDARGRPLSLPEDPATRNEVNRKWLWDLGVREE